MSNLEFAVGKRVVCVDDRPPFGHLPAYPLKMPMKGTVYTIREFLETPNGLGIIVEEIRNGPHPYSGKEECFHPARFRPVRETSIDCFTKLLEKQPELVGGDA